MNRTRVSDSAVKAAVSVLASLILAACGGGGQDSSSTDNVDAQSPGSGATTSAAAVDGATANATAPSMHAAAVSSNKSSASKVATAVKTGATSTAVAGQTRPASTPTNSWIKIASENGSFTVVGTKTVRFGTGSNWIQKTMIGTGQCSISFFGSDPAPGFSKECDGPATVTVPPLRPAPVPTPPLQAHKAVNSGTGMWTKIASEWATFSVSGTQTVRFGTGSNWVEKAVTGSAQCSYVFFGNDPAPGMSKECDVASQTPPAVNLATLVTPASAVMQYVGPTPMCSEGFTPGPSLTATAPVPIPSGGGAFFAASDLARWLVRIAGSPFVSVNDYAKGSPGDWARILGNSNTFLTSGDIPLTATSMTQEGILTRDAAFVALVNNNSAMATAVRNHLIAMAQTPTNNFATTLCYRALNGTAPGGDAWMNQAVWINRYTVIYDLIRSKLSTTDRLVVENWLRTQAYFFAGELDYDLTTGIFPNRLAGDYSVRIGNASSTTKTPYMTSLMDTNGDCYVNGNDIQTPFPVYTYVDSAGHFGGQLSYLSQWYNNRRANLAVAIGSVGVLLNDTVLVNRAKRYHMEWLTWSVQADGSEGEYARAGNYCTPQQGLIYAQSNIQAMLQLSTWLKNRGDTDLVNFYTTDGAWGSQVSPGQAPKNMEKVVSTQLALFMGTLKWYQPEPWLATQNPRSATSIGAMTSRYMNSGNPVDNNQQLGVLIGEYVLPNQPIRSYLLRDPSTTTLPFPGATGNTVITGQGTWSDVFGALPAVFMWEL
jgi:hypothetical protein